MTNVNNAYQLLYQQKLRSFPKRGMEAEKACKWYGIFRWSLSTAKRGVTWVLLKLTVRLTGDKKKRNVTCFLLVHSFRDILGYYTVSST